jgi:peptidoglycan/xylan/chitin deacetylase (PgdA/CDA1 family)
MSLPPDRLRQQLRALRVLGRLHVTFDDGFVNTCNTVRRLLDDGFAVTLFVCPGLADDGGAPLLISELASDDAEDIEQLRTFTWAELRELAAAGARVAAHTMTHPHLPEVDDAALQHEVLGSKQRIEHELQSECLDFGYPYGEHDERVRAAVRAAGYERGFALDSSAGPLAVPRLDLYRRHTASKALGRAGRFCLSSLVRSMPKEAVRTPLRGKT